MKKILVLLIMLLFSVSCSNDEFKEKTVLNLVGTWVINNESEITFNADEEFTMTTPYGNVDEGNYSLLTDENKLCIVYAMDDEGEDLMSDEDYENGWECQMVIIDKNNIKLSNLPYYREKITELKRK
jgi:hypothetical protein